MIDEHLAELTRPDAVPAEALAAAAFATAPGGSAAAVTQATPADSDPWSTLRRWGR